MKILVYGIGALGSVYACLMKNDGHQVIGLDREFVAQHVAQIGVSVNGIWGEHHAALDKVSSDYRDLRGEGFDLIIVTVKAFATEAAAQQVQELLSPSTYVMLAQNGYGNFEAASKFIPQDRLILARVIFGAETEELGKSKVTVIADDVILGSPRGEIDENYLEELAAAFSQAGIPTRFSTAIMKYVWGKIIYNSALNPLGAILEVPYGKLADGQYSRNIMNQIIEEIFAVLAASRQETLWPDSQAYEEAFYTQMIPTTALHHASMLQDIQRGRKTEIDALNGAVVELGKRYGVPTPVNQVITALLKTKESSH
ncbi:MAG TPA: ketopantoate reductase family protein [Syntrophomonadaceae bacterium]|nr:ketopantoate reductase family protein [Syntrophomonadaceae bacterium]